MLNEWKWHGNCPARMKLTRWHDRSDSISCATVRRRRLPTACTWHFLAAAAGSSTAPDHSLASHSRPNPVRVMYCTWSSDIASYTAQGVHLTRCWWWMWSSVNHVHLYRRPRPAPFGDGRTQIDAKMHAQRPCAYAACSLCVRRPSGQSQSGCK